MKGLAIPGRAIWHLRRPVADADFARGMAGPSAGLCRVSNAVPTLYRSRCFECRPGNLAYR